MLLNKILKISQPHYMIAVTNSQKVDSPDVYTLHYTGTDQNGPLVGGLA